MAASSEFMTPLIKRFATTFFRRIGLLASPLEECFGAMKRIGFKPEHIVDVGANHGGWTRTALRYFPDAYYTLLEPQAWLKKSVEDLLASNPRIRWFNVGAGEKKGTLKFTLAERDDSSSFRFSPEEAQALGRKQVDVPVVTIEELVRESSLPVPDIIKIDAEGTDLAVLKGTGSFLGVTEIVFVEAGVMHKKIENDVLSAMQMMREHGYRLFDITDLNRTQKHGALWLVELAFVKIGSALDAAVTSYV
jgi:FkbM family methyltransferase